VEAEELARVALPARQGRPDVALANVLGTVVHFVAFDAGESHPSSRSRSTTRRAG
jgi:hypothetical protein